jgi:hypothetical protein
MSTALILPRHQPETPVFRAPPHNLEAEQALLGAILVNNEAIDRVSSFLKPTHFYDALHARLYEATAKLILGGKRATPITLKTFFQAEEPVGELTVPQYLGRLAANATTIINAEDYGRTIYDLALRRQLIGLGETMVNTAFDSPIDAEPSGNGINLVIRTAEQWFVGPVEVRGKVKAPPNDGQLANAARLDLGTPFDEEDLDNALKSMTDLLQRNGLYLATVKPTVERNSEHQQVAFNFAVSSGKRARFVLPIVTGDTRIPADVERLADAATGELGGIDIWVNNAAQLLIKPLIEMTDDDWHGLLATNLHGYFHGCRAAARRMVRLMRAHTCSVSSSAQPGWSCW